MVGVEDGVAVEGGVEGGVALEGGVEDWIEDGVKDGVEGGVEGWAGEVRVTRTHLEPSRCRCRTVQQHPACSTD